MTRSTRHRTFSVHRRSADRVRARPRLEGLEDRSLLSTTITEYPIPTASAGPQGITQGPDGNLWFVENVAKTPEPTSLRRAPTATCGSPGATTSG
jgi:hypothetical protein